MLPIILKHISCLTTNIIINILGTQKTYMDAEMYGTDCNVQDLELS